MQDQVKLLNDQSKKKFVEPTFNEVMGAALNHALNGTKELLSTMDKRVERINQRV